MKHQKPGWSRFIQRSTTKQCYPRYCCLSPIHLSFWVWHIGCCLVVQSPCNSRFLIQTPVFLSSRVCSHHTHADHIRLLTVTRRSSPRANLRTPEGSVPCPTHIHLEHKMHMVWECRRTASKQAWSKVHRPLLISLAGWTEAFFHRNTDCYSRVCPEQPLECYHTRGK